MALVGGGFAEYAVGSAADAWKIPSNMSFPEAAGFRINSLCRWLGADEVLDTAMEGWRERLRSVLEGRSPDVVFDPVRGPLFEPAFRSLRWGGRYLVIGFAGGPIPALPANLPLMKGAALVGVDVRQFLEYEGDHARKHLDQLLGWVTQGRLSPPVGRTFALDEFAQALEFALTGRGLGKTVGEVAGDHYQVGTGCRTMWAHRATARRAKGSAPGRKG